MREEPRGPVVIREGELVIPDRDVEVPQVAPEVQDHDADAPGLGAEIRDHELEVRFYGLVIREAGAVIRRITESSTRRTSSSPCVITRRGNPRLLWSLVHEPLQPFRGPLSSRRDRYRPVDRAAFPPRLVRSRRVHLVAARRRAHALRLDAEDRASTAARRLRATRRATCCTPGSPRGIESPAPSARGRAPFQRPFASKQCAIAGEDDAILIADRRGVVVEARRRVPFRERPQSCAICVRNVECRRLEPGGTGEGATALVVWTGAADAVAVGTQGP